MDIKIVGHDPLQYGKIPMTCDSRLDSDKLKFPHCFQSFTNSFNLLINGSSGSGKSNLMISMLKSRNDLKHGIRRGFKGVFDTVVIISPSLKTLKDDVFDGLKHRYEILDSDTLDEIDELLASYEDGEKTLLILDDCGSYLKGSVEKRFNHMVKNRRHLGGGLSIMCITQKFKDASTTHRANLTHFICFKPRNELEMTSIYDEVIGEPRKYMHDIMNSIFNKRFNHLMVDFTQHHGQGFQYYSNFRPIDFVLKNI